MQLLRNAWLLALLSACVVADTEDSKNGGSSSGGGSSSVYHNTLAGPLVIKTTYVTDGYHTTAVPLTGNIITSGTYTVRTTYTITAGSTQTVPAGAKENAAPAPTGLGKYALGGVAAAVFGVGALL